MWAPTMAVPPPLFCWNLPTSLRGKKRDGYSVWLLWTDAEEAVKSWSDDADSLTEPATWRPSGSRTEPPRRSRHFC